MDFFLLTFIIYIQLTNRAGECVSDLNMAHFQYVANNLGPGECRKLVASLHFTSNDVPNALQQAERKVLKDESCLQQLLHWNSEISGKQGATHEILVRRLKQINRNDLAVWLTKATYNTINKSLAPLVSETLFRMYEPILLPYVNYSTRQTDVTQPVLKITTPESIIRVIKQNVPDSVEDIVVDPTEWTIFDTISWSIVTILFLLVIVLLVYLTLASPCCNRKKRCQCSAPSSPRNSANDYNMTSSNRSSPLSCVRLPNQHPHESKNHPQRHFETPYLDGKNTHSYKKHQKEYSICGHSDCQAAQTYCTDCINSRHKRQAQFSESPSYNEVGSYNHSYEVQPCKVPPAPRPICHGGSTCLANDYNDSHSHHNGARTIDIHQKIAIPMNNVENSN